MATIGKSLATACISAIDIPKVELAPAITEALSHIPNTTNNEVNHRPAGQ